MVGLEAPPTNVNAASVSIAISSSGAFSGFKATILMTQDEALDAIRQASQVGLCRTRTGGGRLT